MKVFACALLMLMPLISFSQKVTKLVSTYKKDTALDGKVKGMYKNLSFDQARTELPR